MLTDTLSLDGKGHGMPRCAAVTIALLFGAMTLPSGLLAAERTPAAGTSGAVQSVDDGINSKAFAIGDRLKITLFERYAAGTSGSAISSLIEFPEVTGEYVVQQDGTVFLPLLGELKVVDQTPGQVQARMIEIFSRVHGGSLEANVKVLEREPIYVTGAIAEPGTYKHVPGMTVLHAITLARGPVGGRADAWRRFDVARERERTRKSEERLARLHAKYAVLDAELRGQPAQVAIRSRALVALVGLESAQGLVSEAARLREFESSKVRTELDAYQQVLSALEKELAALREGLQEADKALINRSQRAATVTNLRSRGVATDLTVNLAENDLTTAQERWNETRMAIARVERNLAQVRQEKTRFSANEQLEREREFVRIKTEISDEEVTMEVMAHMLLALPKETNDPQSELEVRIVRRSPVGTTELPASDLTPLWPGDLVKVMLAPVAPSLAKAESSSVNARW
jgi:protein involved in polysaccharide export with SLBB domain